MVMQAIHSNCRAFCFADESFSEIENRFGILLIEANAYIVCIQSAIVGEVDIDHRNQVVLLPNVIQKKAENQNKKKGVIFTYSLSKNYDMRKEEEAKNFLFLLHYLLMKLTGEGGKKRGN